MWENHMRMKEIKGLIRFHRKQLKDLQQELADLKLDDAEDTAHILREYQMKLKQASSEDMERNLLDVIKQKWMEKNVNKLRMMTAGSYMIKLTKIVTCWHPCTHCVHQHCATC